MSYHGLIPMMKAHLLDLKELYAERALSHGGHPLHPRVLEIGIDKGQTLIPLYSFLQNNFKLFEIIGCDIYVRPHVGTILAAMQSDASPSQLAYLQEESSLTMLPRCLEIKTDNNDRGFDLILIDGDHNYRTVKEELHFCTNLLAPAGIIVLDDYNGKHANKDMFYSEDKETIDNTDLATPAPTEESSKQGVKTAVDEFLENNLAWSLAECFLGHTTKLEPAILYRNREWQIEDVVL